MIKVNTDYFLQQFSRINNKCMENWILYDNSQNTRISKEFYTTFHYFWNLCILSILHFFDFFLRNWSLFETYWYGGISLILFALHYLIILLFRVLYLAMSPDGQSIVTGAGDESLRCVLCQYLRHCKHICYTVYGRFSIEILIALFISQNVFNFIMWMNCRS